MPTLRHAFYNAVSALLVLLVVAGCVTGPQVADRTDEQTLDPYLIWERTEQQHADAIRAMAQRKQLQSDYATIIRLSRDGDLRGRAFVRLAELDLAAGENEAARDNLMQALRAELAPEHRPQALLLLGDVLERRLREPDDAATAYQQIINEYPSAPEAELARLRMGTMNHERQ